MINYKIQLRSHLLGKAPPLKPGDLPPAGSAHGEEPLPKERVKKVKTPVQEAESQLKKATLKIGMADGLEGMLARAGMCLRLQAHVVWHVYFGCNW